MKRRCISTTGLQKGFTVIQAVALAEIDPFLPNASGDEPLIDRDPRRPNERYFAHVDALVKATNGRGLYIGMLPCWGSYFSENESNCIFDPASGQRFGEFHGKHYVGADLIWILGADRNVRTEHERGTVTAIADGLTIGDGGRHRKTYHLMGPGHSSEMFHVAHWLDFNIIQSSHAAHGFDNGLMVKLDRTLSFAFLSLDGEPRYEGVPAGFYFAGCNPSNRMDDVDTRNVAYCGLLAGACGHTYGNNSIWQMYAPGREAVIWARIPWFEAIHHPGSRQMSHVRTLFTQRPFEKLIPAQEMILDGPSHGPAKIRAARASDGAFALIYSLEGEAFTVDMRGMRSRRVAQTSFDPRYGIFDTFHTGVRSILTFTSPNGGRGCDWTLVLDDPEWAST